ncbi:DNA-binding protein [Nesterenkonia sp. AN1]|uniref:helix-turn-helix domain-containing protein n=1 Tax=Nesterenkonia sp. AN1 TaxID=652017 RepID=UPI0004494A44|nr:DNA-binding protein [Nesterenkonia sp. AN1]MBO0596369.1 helix-turn-helix domain-containing protein [Nesterenkonia sp. E16_10]MBO0597403.1 helix-turn-helix domain-containing protein [Nesterenkonia sp. E16_7]
MIPAPATPLSRDTTPPTPRLLLTVRDVAEQLGTGKDFVYARIADGSIPAIHIGSNLRPKTRVLPEDLSTYIRSRRVAA